MGPLDLGSCYDGLTVEMILDLDIYRSANVLVKRHGQDAPIEAAADSGLRLLYCSPGRLALP